LISALLEATPRRKGQTAPPPNRSPYEGIKSQPLHHGSKDGWCQAATPTVDVTGVPSDDSSHHSAIPDAVAAPWDLRRRTRKARYCSRRPSGPASHWGRGPATTRVRPRGALSSHGRSAGPPPFGSPGPPRVPRTFWCVHPHSDQGVRGRRAPPLPQAHAGPSFVGPTECHRAKYHAPAITTPPPE